MPLQSIKAILPLCSVIHQLSNMWTQSDTVQLDIFQAALFCWCDGRVVTRGPRLSCTKCQVYRGTHERGNTHTQKKGLFVAQWVNHCVWYLHLRQGADHRSSCLFHINSLSHALTPLILPLLLAAGARAREHAHSGPMTATASTSSDS